MLRPVSLSPALLAVATTLAALPLGTLGPVPTAAAHDHTDRSDRTPSISRAAARSLAASPQQSSRPHARDHALTVTMATLTPSAIPRRGKIRITGSVTNRSDETWRAINVHPFISDAPITSSAELATQTDRDATDYVGDRITVPGNFDNVGNLEPGESASYSIALSRNVLTQTEPGVYWFGVHALGETDTIARDGIADGRARTFMPLVPRTNRALPTALVVPVRRGVTHRPDGRVAGVRSWAEDLSSGGSLRSLVDFGAAAGNRPLTWLVDPAVPDTVQQLVEGNPERSLADTVEEPPGEEVGEDSGTPDPTPEPSGDGTESPGPSTDDLPTNPATEPGTAWLNRFREALSDKLVLALPYGDLDVSGAAEHDPQAYQQARRRSGTQLEPFGIETRPGVGSPSGFLDPDALATITPRTTTLVTERMFGDRAPGRAQISDRRLIVTSQASDGGPGPGDRRSSIAMRQQILSEAAVRLLSPGRRPLVVVLPDDWTPTSATGFFSGLDQEWVDLTDLDGLGDGAGGRFSPDRLTYPEIQVRRELDAANFAAARALADAGATLQNVLLRNDRVGDEIATQALSTLSYSDRDRPDAARVAADRARAWVARRLGRITINAPLDVTLSGNRGSFSATLVNDLDHPVSVRVEALLADPMRISGPADIQIAARSQTSVLLRARTARLGVTNVQLIVTDARGTPLGSTDELPIRSGQVSQVIWVIMGAGVALLFGAILVRLVRRISRARRARALQKAAP